MRPVWVIARREFRALVESRAFVFGSAVGLVAILALALLPTLVDFLEQERPQRLVVVDRAGGIFEAMQELARSAGDPAGVPVTLVSWGEAFPGRPLPDPAWTERWPQDKEGDVFKEGSLLFVDVRRSVGGELEWWLVGQDVPERLRRAVQALATPVAVADRARRLGLGPEEVATLRAPARVKVADEAAPLRGGETGGPEAVDPGRRGEVGPAPGAPLSEAVGAALSFALMFILYMSLILYGSAVTTGVAAEKGNRVVEMMLVAARPEDLLRGKLLGIGAASLLQYLVWGGAGALAFALRRGWVADALSRALGVPVTLTGVPWWMAAYLVLFFLLGFAAYGSLFAASGCLARRPEEASQTTWPPVVLIVASYLLASITLADPRSRLAVVSSLLPFIGPMVMYTRIAMSSAPAGEVGLSVAVALATAALSLRLAGRVYRRSLLSTQRTGWLGVWRGVAPPAGG